MDVASLYSIIRVASLDGCSIIRYMYTRVWHFGFETSRFRNFLIFFNGIGIGFGKFWYRKKYRYRFRKNLVSKKVSVSVSKIFGIEKSIGFEKFDIGFEKFWYRKKYQFLKILLKKQEILSKISRGGDACFCRWPEILSKISRGGGACFCQSGNPLKNIKGWRCLFLPIR